MFDEKHICCSILAGQNGKDFKVLNRKYSLEQCHKRTILLYSRTKTMRDNSLTIVFVFYKTIGFCNELNNHFMY